MRTIFHFPFVIFHFPFTWGSDNSENGKWNDKRKMTNGKCDDHDDSTGACDPRTSAPLPRRAKTRAA